MNIKMIVKIQVMVLWIESVLMMPPLMIGIVTGDRPAVRGFAFAIVFALLLGAVGYLFSKDASHSFYAKEGLLTTGLTWIVMSLVGCLPFFISGRITNFFDAFFEIVSGFTTTGASILPDVEAMGKALLYWRSFSHWIGGMGVLVFFLAIIPVTGKDNGFTLHLLRAESPGPEVNKMVPRMRDSAAILYVIYCVLTVLDIIFLLIGGLPVFDAFCIAFGTAGTGGFGVLNTGCATYSPFAQYVTTVFMLLFGINFSLYYLVLLKKWKVALKDEELHFYGGMVALAIAVISFNIFHKTLDTMNLEETFRHAAFQVASIVTTTGYSTVDFDLWPSLSKTIIVFLMLAGACAGSTGGGIKNVRLILLLKTFKRKVHEIFHPNEIRVVKLNRQRVSEQTLSNVSGYLIAYVLIIVVSVIVLAADGINFDFETNFTAVMATFNNIGPGLSGVGPTRNFSGYNNLSTLLLSFDMLLGRLEIFPILALISPSVYRRNT